MTVLGIHCKFPFYWNGTEYYECTDDDGDIAKWCDTEDDWGYCGEGCQRKVFTYRHTLSKLAFLSLFRLTT